jgi:hypothetical protein
MWWSALAAASAGVGKAAGCNPARESRKRPATSEAFRGAAAGESRTGRREDLD